MTCSVTLALPPRAGAKQSPMMTNKSTKNEQSFEKKTVLTGKQFEDFRRKKIKKKFSLDQKTPWNTRPLKTIIEYGFCK